jgi:pimeloyl-ACP methyl ester carboxylesterase
VSEVESRTIEANGLSHHVLLWNGPRERTVFALHGYLDQSTSLVALGDAIAAEGHRVVAPDFRGHGRTEWIPRGAYYHFPDYLADLTGLVDALAPASDGPITLVAHSMGGSVATLFAGTYPERVRALALLEGTGPPRMPPEIAPDRTRRWLEGLSRRNARDPRRIASLDEAVERLRVTHGGTVPDDVLRRVAAELTRPHPDGDGLAWRFDPLHQTTSPMRFDADTFEQFAARIDAPVLLVDAGESGMRYPDVSERQRAYRTATHVTLEGTGHMMHWTQPDRVASTVCAFLRRVGA